MNNKLIMQSLPLVAAVLGNKYGVKVNIGGTEAFTDGNTINLPALPMDCDQKFIGLARGYIDHESAHIRDTDFDALQKANLTPLEMNIWNSIEDWRVEEKLAVIFPGCRGNFHWLIKHIFCRSKVDDGSPPVKLIPDWILLSVRSWNVPDLSGPRNQEETIIESRYPGLPGKINSVLQEVRSNCVTTSESILYAKKIVALLKSEVNENNRSQSPRSKTFGKPKNSFKASPGPIPTSDQNQSDEPKTQLEKLIHAKADQLPKAMGEILQEHLAKESPTGAQDKVSVAVVGKRDFNILDTGNSHELSKSTTALKTRLQSTLQSILLKRSHISRKGRLDNRQLHKVAISDPRMFIKPEERQGFNTAVHILIDCSSSMRRRMALTTQSCYALAKALGSIKDVNVGVTAFPADPPKIHGCRNFEIPAVCPVIKHGARIHSRFHTRASGCTPMGEAIWWVLQQMVPLTESRKIILILSDGSPDYLSNTVEAINQGKKLGFEFYGIGIDARSIESILPNSSRSINNLSELAPAMFRIMKTVFSKNK
ncbi:VWA domain-containing protein [Desulfobacter curvatus]|uniref:VWA domain-containing protein n=1 Tax=Desulfobacter curvatus TaxID=2290 RepID=UPI000374A7AC|nr:VWA domain-containing protein [Desulfobacter curvatus]